jgi:hypothetical protein
MLKQQLASCYDFDFETFYKQIDDCNLQFIDASAIKRFLIKCRVYPSDDLLIAVIRRLDLDSDARLTRKEFRDGILPLENFTKRSLAALEQSVAAAKVVRPKPQKT